MDTKDVSGFPLALEGDAVPMVSFRKVTKSYGSLVVLDSLDLDIAEGEMVTIIGPSGSGKTTVLRMLMTLETINGGVIYVDGQPLTHMERGGRLVPADNRHLRTIRSKIGMCFQHFNLFPHMTALENCMEGPVHVLGLSKRASGRRSCWRWSAWPTSATSIPRACRVASSSASPSPARSPCGRRSCCSTR
jgi:polar amino acid transport system ATP-binding protein